jgi:hypothetical protein
MPRYFLHQRDGVDEILDPDGTQFETLDELRRSVLAGARDLMSADVKQGKLDLRYRIDAENEAGQLVLSIPFKEAVSITGD